MLSKPNPSNKRRSPFPNRSRNRPTGADKVPARMSATCIRARPAHPPQSTTMGRCRLRPPKKARNHGRASDMGPSASTSDVKESLPRPVSARMQEALSPNRPKTQERPQAHHASAPAPLGSEGSPRGRPRVWSRDPRGREGKSPAPHPRKPQKRKRAPGARCVRGLSSARAGSPAHNRQAPSASATP